MVIFMQEYKKQTRTVQEAAAREQTFWKKNQLWTLLLAAAVLLYTLIGGPGFSVAPGSTELLLTMHDGETAAVAYGSITEAELLENPQYGTMVEGKDERTGKSGTWEHPEWGTCTLCVYASCDTAVRILTEERCYVVNLSSETETEQLYQLILDKIPASR